jgi:TonB family protein
VWRRGTGFGLILGGSTLAHVGIGLVFWAGLRLLGAYQPPPRQVVMARLVRLGKPRPKELLPRLPDQPLPPAPTPSPAPPPPPIVAPAPPVRVVPPAVVPTASPKPLPPQPMPLQKPAAPRVPSTNARGRARALGRLRQALERIKTEVAGQQDGSAAGDADAAIAGERYSAEIDACLHAHYVIEGYAAERVAGVLAQVAIRIDSTGKIIDYRLEKSSGVAAFDQAVGRAVTRCGKVSPPPPHLRRAIGKEGIEITFRP